MKRNLDTGLIRSFVCVAATGNMTAAADRLGLTQGAVSQQIRRLEEVLRATLFDRSRRGLTLTRQGEHLLHLSKPFLAMNDEILREMTTPAVRGSVRLGVPYDLVSAYLPRVLQGFADTHPHIEVELACDATTSLFEAMERGDADIAIVEEPVGAITGECLCIERLLWIGAPSGAAHRKRPLPLSIVSDVCVFRPAVHSALRMADIAWRTVFENGNIEATMTTVRADLAVTPSLASVIPNDLEVLAADCGLPDLPGFSISLLVRRNDPDPAVGELAAHIRRAFAAKDAA